MCVFEGKCHFASVDIHVCLMYVFVVCVLDGLLIMMATVVTDGGNVL